MVLGVETLLLITQGDQIVSKWQTKIYVSKWQTKMQPNFVIHSKSTYGFSHLILFCNKIFTKIQALIFFAYLWRTKLFYVACSFVALDNYWTVTIFLSPFGLPYIRSNCLSRLLSVSSAFLVINIFFSSFLILRNPSMSHCECNYQFS